MLPEPAAEVNAPRAVEFKATPVNIFGAIPVPNPALLPSATAFVPTADAAPIADAPVIFVPETLDEIPITTFEPPEPALAS